MSIINKIFQIKENIILLAFIDRVLEHEHKQTDNEKDNSMENISEHNSKDEWESDNRKQSRIYFLIIRNPTNIDNRLELLSETVQFE